MDRQQEDSEGSGAYISSDDDGLRQDIFVQHGRSVVFYIHKSVKRREKIEADIKRHGGHVTDKKREAQTILVGPSIDLQEQRFVYYWDRRNHSTYIERGEFVGACLKQGKYEHRESMKQSMPGRPTGGGRVRRAFTEEEDRNLCRYIAMYIPDKEAGGRMGNYIYDYLVKLGETHRSYSWANRHTSLSWRERYKNNREMFDDIIEENVKANIHLGSDKRVKYHLDRRAQKRRRMASSPSDSESDGDERDHESSHDLQEDDSGKNSPSSPQPDHQHSHARSNAPGPSGTQNTLVNPPSGDKALEEDSSGDLSDHELFGSFESDNDKSNSVDSDGDHSVLSRSGFKSKIGVSS